jgi:hypothetical protein
MQEVVAGLSGKTDKLYAEGLHVAGERYVLTKAEDRSLYARKVRSNFLTSSCSIMSQNQPQMSQFFEPHARADRHTEEVLMLIFPTQ